MNPLKVVSRPDGAMPRRAVGDRFCRDCGKKVTMYKNPQSRNVRCYACEDEQPWSYMLIAGGDASTLE